MGTRSIIERAPAKFHKRELTGWLLFIRARMEWNNSASFNFVCRNDGVHYSGTDRIRTCFTVTNPVKNINFPARAKTRDQHRPSPKTRQLYGRDNETIFTDAMKLRGGTAFGRHPSRKVIDIRSRGRNVPVKYRC